MNFKSTLWALAFACAAVSCSDDVDDGLNKGNNGSEQKGEGVYVTVNVTSAFNPVTKAGENGNGDLEDSDKESAVYDVNIFLIQVTPNQDYSGMTANDISQVNADKTTKIYSGYSTDVMEATGSIEHHDLEATVNVSVPDLDQWYHVLTVVNAGKKLGFTTLGELRDYLQKTAWTGNNTFEEADHFVMSTHQMWQQNVGGSDLFVSLDNTDPMNPAETTVYVERLAARIDLNLKENLIIGANPQNAINDNDLVKITGYQVINQLNGGTFMLKRVTDHTQTTNVDGNIPNNYSVTYIGDEVWQEGLYNYVIDPWTANKKTTEDVTFPTSINNHDAYYEYDNESSSYSEKQNIPIDLSNLYVNHFVEGLNKTEFMTFKPISSDNISTTEGQFTPLLYTQENTADVSQQKKGFTTGVIFEANYAPEHLSEYSEETHGVSNEVDYENNTSFLVADFEHESAKDRKLCADMRTIAVLGFSSSANSDVIGYIFDKTPVKGNGVTVENYRNAIDGMSGGPLVKAFQKYLQEKFDSENFDAVLNELTWTKFVENSKTDSEIADVPSDSELSGNTEAALTARMNLMKNYNIAYYDGGKNYYKYWIKHNPLADDKKMGVMEFAIVRNNVYQLEVTGIKDLGDPLPFTPGKDNPEDPVKEPEEVKILVNLYVKNWVKRSNGGIIL